MPPSSKSPRGRNARLTQAEEIALFTKQQGHCAMCGNELKPKSKNKRGKSGHLFDCIHNHRNTLAANRMKYGFNTKPNQLLCKSCHNEKTRKECSNFASARRRSANTAGPSKKRKERLGPDNDWST